MDQPGLFDAEGLARDVELTLGDGPLVHPARVGFLAGMLSTWVYDGKTTPAQKDRLKNSRARTIQRAQEDRGAPR